MMFALQPRHSSGSDAAYPRRGAPPDPASTREVPNALWQRLATRSPAVLPKLEVGAVNDPLEREADRVADAVVGSGAGAMTAGEVHTGAAALRRCPDCPPGGRCPRSAEEARRRGDGGLAIQAKPAPGALLAAPASAQAYAAGRAGPGSPLGPQLRSYFEPRFGRDFGRVRLHTDNAAAEAAREVGARAYTVGDHIVFGSGQFRPESDTGRRLLAHELAHTVQQGSGGLVVARQCNPAWAGLDWSQRVTNARGMRDGAAKNQCMADMIDEALSPNVIVEERTNTARGINQAVMAGRYVEWGTLAELHVNYDGNLNAKTGNPDQYGQTTYQTLPAGNDIRIFIVLGPRALNPIGPQHTQMAFEHENEHAGMYILDWAVPGPGPHSATTGEELQIYTEGLTRYLLDFFTIDNTPPGRFFVSEPFFQVFGNYAAATTTQAERDQAFGSISTFYDVRIKAIPCNLMKFKLWLQMIQNARPAGDALVARINALPGLSLAHGTPPATHFDIKLGCT